MSTGLDRIELSKFSGIGDYLPHWPLGGLPRFLHPGFLWLPLALLAGLGAWMLWPDDRGGVAQSEPVQLAAATTETSSSPLDSPVQATVPAVAEANVSEEPGPLDRMKISSQFWRRGGLGSNALVTLTLRNNNTFAVKNIEVACAFARRDGSHLTDRRRLIADTVNSKSRKTFARLHVGFVNINADKAKCSLVAASRI